MAPDDQVPPAERRGASDERLPSVFAELLRRTPRVLTVTDLVAIVCGFALAGYIYRATPLAAAEPSAQRWLVIAASFGWLGIVLSGPLVLLLRRLEHGSRMELSSGEQIWGLLGLPWAAVALARAVPMLEPLAAMRVASYAAILAAGLAPVLTVVVWHLERNRPGDARRYAWSDRVGICCAAAWPAGWTLTALLLGA